ncbi:regulator of chromosome condensation (RCC1) repeat-containing protein [Cardiosporidium cionae]|uniref:Regulator of chromosome condensation (RCC1) repeat-containing protein n=1 Tax=Cardiosporidium cionae TaxID=476202 RepID=A0ABQ7JDJ5_9APIC|nr:regulator of chromosome condensation (RCC1) repeat-containing protein [Cardiosporidium cionae]|eukprot:KAF8822073.1 regulator of chromosome condensation (RCC1) repeat-containing protein [Cardiosporidium cionae]
MSSIPCLSFLSARTAFRPYSLRCWQNRGVVLSPQKHWSAAFPSNSSRACMITSNSSVPVFARSDFNRDVIKSNFMHQTLQSKGELPDQANCSSKNKKLSSWDERFRFSNCPAEFLNSQMQASQFFRFCENYKLLVRPLTVNSSKEKTHLESYMPLQNYSTNSLLAVSVSAFNDENRYSMFPIAWIALAVGAFASSQCFSIKAQCAEHSASQPQVFSWGSGIYGQLGHGDYLNQPYPHEAESFCLEEEEYLVFCNAGKFSSACISNLGKLYTWGKTQDNLLGHGAAPSSTSATQSTPKEVEWLQVTAKFIVRVASGHGHMVAITNAGEVYSWGANNLGQCGRSDDAESDSLWSRRRPDVGIKIGRVMGPLEHKKIIQVACRKNHSLVLADDGKVYTWGSNRDGQLGASVESTFCVSPIELDISGISSKIVEISCGSTYSALLTEDGKLYTWGSDEYGQLGHGKQSRRLNSPKLVRGLSSHRIASISCGEFHMAAISREGEVFVWGYGRDGQCGHGDLADISLPKKVESLKHLRATGVSCGGAHTAVIVDGCRIFMFGRGREGQLGRADNVESIAVSRSLPVEVEYFHSANMKIDAVSCGGDHTVGIISAGKP